MGSRRPLLLWAAALAVRLVYVWQIRDAPYFDVPLVDGANYVATARLIAGGDLLAGREAFWQPPLYPYFLAPLVALFGPRLLPIYLVQAALGALSCVLVYFIGRRLFGERAAVCAALVMALYGPLVHFDAQPLIPVLHVALVLGGLLQTLRAESPRGWGLAGLLWGLAAIATPNVLLAIPVVAAWISARSGRVGAVPADLRRRWLPAALFLAGVAAPIGMVAARNLAVAGEPVLISSNGGINFYIGNNPDYERTVRIRPGGEFERLVQEPENLGIVGAAARSRFFAVRAFQFLGRYPGQALRLYARKALDLIAGREIPRNQDPYAYRRHSPLLAVLLWRFGIAFPFGLVAPLALAGATLRAGGGTAGAPAPDDAARPGRRLLLLYAAAYAASILIVFPTDRYRLPLVPVAALFAGDLLAALPAALRRPRVLAALATGLVLFNLDAGKPSAAYPEEEALNTAYALRVRGRSAEARAEYLRALALDPGRIDAHNSLAAMAAQEGRWEDAARHYEALLAVAPDFVEVRRNLGQAYAALGRTEEARSEWQIAVGLAPGAAAPLTDLCMSYLDEGALRAAEPYCERAVRSRPDLPDPHLAMARVARALGQTERARSEAAEAARLFPAGTPGRERAERILRRLSGAATGE
jgi:tetratricopeptide (TPR) repeat protein